MALSGMKFPVDMENGLTFEIWMCHCIEMLHFFTPGSHARRAHFSPGNFEHGWFDRRNSFSVLS